MEALAESWRLLLFGTITSLRVFVLSLCLAGILALLLGVLRQSRSTPIRWAAAGWVEFFRGISSVVLLFWLYFALPFLGLSLSAESSAIIGLGLVHSAYGSEVVRGAIQAVPRDQWEAAIALGYTRRQTLLQVILPQAFVAMLPPIGNSLVLLLKGTSIASTITVPELTFQSTLLMTRTLAVVPIFSCVLLIYYFLAVVAVHLVRAIEVKAGRWRPQGET